MGLFYTSPFIKQQITSPNHLVSLIPKNKITLVLDTNICIYLRDFYQSPLNLKSETWELLREFLFNVEYHDFEVNFGLGCEEACRSKETFEVNEEKREQMTHQIKKVFDMNFAEMLQYKEAMIFHKSVRDESNKSQTKLKSFNEDDDFQRFILLAYTCLLKLYLLDKEMESEESISKTDQIIKYIDFMEQEMDLIGLSCLIFGIHFFAGNMKIRRILYKKNNKPKTIKDWIHSIWNASIDLVFPNFVSMHSNGAQIIPVFVTNDVALWNIFEIMKFKILNTNGDKIMNIPQFMEIDYPKEGLEESDITKIDNYINRMMLRRMYKMIERPSNSEIVERIRKVAVKLEKEVRIFLAGKYPA